MTLALTDSVVELLDEVAAIVMARKIEACRNADACVDVSPLIVGVKDDNLVWGETNPLLTRPVVDEVRGMLRSMYSHPVMRRLCRARACAGEAGVGGEGEGGGSDHLKK